jgi:hypothetical protein
MALLILTYIYYGFSYFLEFKIDFYSKINNELLILIIEYLMFRYALILVDDDFREFMSNKFFQAKDAEN